MMTCRSCGQEATLGHSCTILDKDYYLGRISADTSTLPEQPFTKHDMGKNMVTLVDPEFILGVGEVLTFGAKKYSKNNWQKNDIIDRYKDSTMRHMYAYLNGELYDLETGLPHLDHIATNIMFLRYFEHGKGKK